MKKSANLLFFISTFYFLIGCSKPSIYEVNFNGENAYNEVRELVFYSPRDAGTTNGHQAAKHIYNKLKLYGIDAELDYFEDTTPVGKKKMINIIGRIPGKTKKWIILGSHFDTMPGIHNFQGANDSGSSCGVLLEISRILANKKLYHGLIFAFFDGEEGIKNYEPGDGLHGSRNFSLKIKNTGLYKQCNAMILLDMVGDSDLTFTIPNNTSPILLKKLYSAANTLKITDKIKYMPYTYIIDDHVPFLEINIPSINIIDFNYGSNQGLNNYWHTSQDNLDHISSKSLKISGTLTLELLNELSVFRQY